MNSAREGVRFRFKPMRTPEERRRLIEVVAMFLVTLALVAISRLEGTIFELSERLSQHPDFISTIVYFGLINLNVVLILVLSFLIFRNVIKLVLERRRGVIGSRVRTKLVLALVFFALAPTALLFYVSTRFLTESFETWFSSKVEATIHKTREAGALVYKRDKRRIESLARIALQRVEVQYVKPLKSGDPPLLIPARLEGFDTEYRLDGVMLYDATGRLVWKSGNHDKRVETSADNLFVLNAIDRFRRNPGMTSRGAVEVENGKDVVKGVAPVWDSRHDRLVGVVVTEEKFETQIIQSVEAILSEFANLRPGAQLIRMSYTILLVLMVLIILFSATWLGFYVAKGLVGPIQSLAEATREVALGNYDIALKARTDDETGQLVHAFNRMIKDLKSNQEKVQSFTLQLELSNEELDRRHRYIEVILRHIQAGVISIDRNGHITSFNHAAERLLSVAADQVIGAPVQRAFGDVLYREFWLPIADGMADKSTFNGQVDISHADSTLTLIASATRIHDENDEDRGIVVVFDDASEQVKAQRVAAWREVAQRIAHEIKNPITPIKLNAQRLLRKFSERFEGEDRKIFESSLDMIVTEVDNLRDLVNEFSKFSRLPAVKTSPEDVNAIISEVSQFYSLSYPSIRFDASRLDRSIPRVPLDKEQMNRVFSNLITNAIAAIREKRAQGIISFSSQTLPNLSMVRLEIADNGVGIPEKLRTRVLEPYFSTKAEGTGLGLAIVNQIVTDHGGYLRIASNEPEGTIVIIELPLGEKVSGAAVVERGQV